MTSQDNSPHKSTIDYLSVKPKKWEPPTPENVLDLHSAKLVFSTRMYPEWMAAAFGVLKKRFPDLHISSASEIFQYSIQLLIKDNFDLIGGVLPPTEDSLDFLIENSFIKASSRRQFQRISKVSQTASRYEEQMTQTTSLKDRIAYWKLRDPEKAKAIEDEAIAEMMATIERDGLEPKKKDYSSDIDPSKPETIVPHEEHRTPSPEKPTSRNSASPDPEDLEAKHREREREQAELKDFLSQLPSSSGTKTEDS